MKRKICWLVAAGLLGSNLAMAASTPVPTPAIPEGTTAQLTLLETTDLHAHVLGYDYYRLQADPTVGLSRTATLIERARKRYANTLLFDAGDTIQGTVAADYQALAKPLACTQELAIYRAMDELGYDAGTLGNHEFNYGLAFLSQVTGTPFAVAGVARKHCAGPDFPLVLSNVFSDQSGKPLYRPWLLLTRTLRATTPDGKIIQAPIRIGVLGFAPPPIMRWDRKHLAGKVHVLGAVDAASRYLPALHERQADLVFAIIHGGPSTGTYLPSMENQAWYLAGLKGIDALLMGHMHKRFPGGQRFEGMREVDNARGHVRGVPAVMADFFGKDLGLIHLQLRYTDGRWVSDPAAARSQLLPICTDATACVPADAAIVRQAQPLHQATIDYVNTPIGQTDFRLSTYFADLGNMTALSVVNVAQRARAAQWVAQTHPEWRSLPLLSAAAAFRTGYGGVDDYTDVAPGAITIRSAADLYYYPNTLAVVKVDGATVKAWLERSADRFNRIDPRATAPQALIHSAMPGYNFDQLQGPGLRYRIDVTRPRGQRIVQLTWQGRPLDPKQTFLVATNNYRAAGGGHFPGLDGTHTVFNSTTTNRALLIAWIQAHPELTRTALPARSWQFVPVTLAGPVTVKAPLAALPVVKQLGLKVKIVRRHADGSATWALDLSP